MKGKVFVFSLGFCAAMASTTVFSAQQPSQAPVPTPVAVPTPGVPPAVPVYKNPLSWDSTDKLYNAKIGDTTNKFIFWVTNTSAQEVIINNVYPSCGCTVAEMPATPWKVAAGTNGAVKATVNFTGKTGLLTKTLTVVSSAGSQVLTMKIAVPEDPAKQQRQQNMLIALQDRQAVFKNDCATCHVQKGEGKKGAELFAADCAICHDPEASGVGHRAEMVPDLKKMNHPTDANFWRTMITSGKPGSLMPAFAKSQEGPLSDEQIDSLVEYCVKAFPSTAPANQPIVNKVAPTPATKPAGGTN